MDYRYLKAFLLTSHFESFSKAAKELHIATSAISRQIKLLEQSVGEDLIVRNSKKVLLTKKGRELFLKCQQFENEIDQLFLNNTLPTIRIGALQGLLEHWLIFEIAKFKKNHGLSFILKSETPSVLKKDLCEGRYDLIFSTEKIDNELIQSELIFEEKLVLISTFEVDLKHLEAHTWIVFNEEDFLYNYTKKRPTQYLFVDSVSAIIALVQEGLGLAILPQHLLIKKHGLIRTELPQIKHSKIYLNSLRYKHRPTHLELFFNFLEEELKTSQFTQPSIQ